MTTTPNSRAELSGASQIGQLHHFLEQYNSMEFLSSSSFWWSTSFATPRPSNMDLLVKFGSNYPPLPPVTQTYRFNLFFHSLCSPLSSRPLLPDSRACHRRLPPPHPGNRPPRPPLEPRHLFPTLGHSMAAGLDPAGAALSPPAWAVRASRGSSRSTSSAGLRQSRSAHPLLRILHTTPCHTAGLFPCGHAPAASSTHASSWLYATGTRLPMPPHLRPAQRQRPLLHGGARRPLSRPISLELLRKKIWIERMTGGVIS